VNGSYGERKLERPKKNSLKFFEEKQPKDGFCEESSSEEGIYYETISSFPGYDDVSNDITGEIPIPLKYKSAPKKSVKLLYYKWIVRIFYFIQIGET
jgi:hypothetical protein